MTTTEAPRAVANAFHHQDLAVWPEGTWTELGEIWNGGYQHMSDDYEKVRLEDHDRLKALGIFDELNLGATPGGPSA